MKSKLKVALKSRTNNKGIVTFQNAKSEPLHRWFPYLEGFSEEFIDIVFNSDKNDISYIYEPFAGSGTVPVYSIKKGVFPSVASHLINSNSPGTRLSPPTG